MSSDDKIFDEALAFTLGREGGYYAGNEARDPNPTNLGVTQKTYDGYRKANGMAPADVKNISMGEVKEIYRSYWTEAGCDKLPRLCAITMFDHSINAGPQAAVKCFQRAMGIVDDGIIGAKTLSHYTIPRSTSDDKFDAHIITLFRLDHYYRIASTNATLRPNLLSWVQRLVKFNQLMNA